MVSSGRASVRVLEVARGVDAVRVSEVGEPDVFDVEPKREVAVECVVVEPASADDQKRAIGRARDADRLECIRRQERDSTPALGKQLKASDLEREAPLRGQ